MLKRCDGREMVCLIDSSLLNRFLSLFLNTGHLHTILRKGNMDELQGRPDGDEYQQNERKCNVSCVFFSRNLYHIRVKLFTVSVVNLL